MGKVTGEEIWRLRKSFALLERHPEVAALVFYQELFLLDPGLRPMFRGDIEGQALKLMELLGTALALLEVPERLVPMLEGLGARHVGYGVEARHYGTVREALMRMLQRVLGDQLTPEMRAAWEGLYEVVQQTMLRGAERAAPAEGG
jgi:hemoglobin-like flavoprotein